MGKLWGYSGKQKAAVSGMLAKQTLSRGQGRKKERQVIMKLPKAFDLQRMVLTKHLARLNRFPVYCGKMGDVNFEDKVEDFKKTVGLRTIRKLRVRDDPENEGTEGRETRLGRLDFNKLRYITFGRWSPWEEIERDVAVVDLQRVRWRYYFMRDQTSALMNEVYVLNRMVTQTCHSLTAYQPPYTMFLESSHYALKVHDWPKVALSISALLQIARKRAYRRIEVRHGLVTLLWMHGLLALVNHFKENIQLVKQYAEYLKIIINPYPKWLGTQVAAWLIQKGYFLEGHAFLTEYSVLSLHSWHRCDTKETMRNHKRNQTNFVAEFINAVKLYSEWRKETALLTNNEQYLDDFGPLRNSIRRKGETSLTAYETLYEQQKITKPDVMCFLEPFVELLVEYRSPNRALEVLQQINNDNAGNLVVEEFFVGFLEKYGDVCGVSEDYISTHRERVNRQKPTLDDDQQHELVLQKKRAKRKIIAIRELKKKNGIVQTFTKIHNPGFSG